MTKDNLLSKEQLAKSFGIDYSTVYRTMKLCGLSTKKRFYTPDEVGVFATARRFLKARTPKAQIKAYFEHYHSMTPIQEQSS